MVTGPCCPSVFLGHFGLAMGAKRLGPGISLGVLIFSAQWADLLWPLLVLAGVERVALRPGITAVTPLDFVHYPWSHGLLMGLIWGIVIGGVYYAWKRRPRDALLVGALVPSHWLLDLVVHRPDLPLWHGGPEVGFGLWDSLAGTLVVEFGILVVGAWLYVASTEARDRVGRWGVYGLVAVLALVYLGTTFGPPPTDATAVATGALALWIVVGLGWWIDSHREVASPT